MSDWYGAGGGYGRSVRFKNDFDSPVLVRWERKNYGTMSAGESVEVDTFPVRLIGEESPSRCVTRQTQSEKLRCPFCH